MVTSEKSLAHVLRANLGTIQTSLRNIDMSEDTTGTGEKGLVRLRDPIKASTTVLAVQDIAGTGAKCGRIAYYLCLDVIQGMGLFET